MISKITHQGKDFIHHINFVINTSGNNSINCTIGYALAISIMIVPIAPTIIIQSINKKK